MRVLITGGTGFVGSHLIEAFAGSEHEVFSLSRQRSEERVSLVADTTRWVFCDLCDPAALRDTLKRIRPDVIIHLASVSSVAYSYDHPREILEVNLIGTVNLVEACRSEVPELRQFLFASTSETYGFGPAPRNEETAQNPSSPYGISKLSAERYLLYVRDAYAFPVTILRPFNTYGRKDTTSFVVERIISQMLRQDSVRLGDPSIVRDWLHIDDHVQAYLACIGREDVVGQVLNFCTGRGASVAELATLASRLTGFRGAVQWHTLPKRPLDVPSVVGNPGKAQTLLGWRPHITFEQGLGKVAAYWRGKLGMAAASELSAKR